MITHSLCMPESLQTTDGVTEWQNPPDSNNSFIAHARIHELKNAQHFRRLLARNRENFNVGVRLNSKLQLSSSILQTSQTQIEWAATAVRHVNERKLVSVRWTKLWPR